MALVAMVVQVLFYTDHIGAVAVKTFGTASADARLGIMEICTGNGVVLIGPDGQPVEQDHDCPICENAAVMAFGEPLQMAWPEFPFVAIETGWDIPTGLHMAGLRFPGAKPIRGPPERI